VSEDLEEQKKQLLDRLESVPERCDKVDSEARGVLRRTAEARDDATLEKILLRNVPTDAPGASEYIRRAQSRWVGFDKALDTVLYTLASDVRTLDATVTTVTANISLGAVDQVLMFPVRWDARQEIDTAEKQHRARRNVDELVVEIRNEMVRLCLDVVGRHRTPAQYIEEAHAALKYPVVADATASVLAPLRSSVDGTVDELIRRRPVTEETGSNRARKLLSIGRYCSRDGLASDHFERLAADDAVLVRELADGLKQKALKRDDVAALFYKAALFLRGLLTSLDETRLRT
jgi:hypothetical protein